MDYEFPVITNIADILPAIEGRDEFVVAERGDHTIINYNVMMNDTFPPIRLVGYDDAVYDRHAILRREARGIIFDTATGNIIRRPLHKFKNVNECDETQSHNVNLSEPHIILEKLDGSMICLFWWCANFRN